MDSSSIQECILCTSDDQLIDIFTSKDGCLSIFSKLHSCVPIVFIDQTLNRYFMCGSCVQNVELFFNFKNMCCRNNSALLGEQHDDHRDGNQEVFISEKSITGENETEIYYHAGMDNFSTTDIKQKPETIVDATSNNNVCEKIIGDGEVTSNYNNDISSNEHIRHIREIIRSDFNDVDHFKNTPEGNMEIVGNAIFTADDKSQLLLNEIGSDLREFSSNFEFYSEEKIVMKFEIENETFQDETSLPLSWSRGKSACESKISPDREDIRCSILKLNERKSKTNRSVLRKKSSQHGTMVKDQSLTYPCDQCDARFSYKEGVYKHIRTVHNKVKKYTCDKCSMRLRDRTDLVRHMHCHGNSTRNHTCSLCSSSFLEKRDLQRHVKIHSGSRPFKCNHCGKDFQKKYALVTHIKIHLGEKPFECFCGAAFGRKWSLDIHTRIHTGDAPFTCNHCEEKFSRKDVFRKHVRKHVE